MLPCHPWYTPTEYHIKTFRNSFTNKLKKAGGEAHTPFNNQSNGGPERTVCSLKQVLKKREIRRTDDMRLQEICFIVKQNSQGKQGSAAEMFLKRNPRSLTTSRQYRKDYQPHRVGQGKTGAANGISHQGQVICRPNLQIMVYRSILVTKN